MSNFKGEYRYAIDEKGRINIPAKFRKLLAPEAQGTFVVTRGLDACLAVYPLDEWEKTIEPRLRSLSANKKANRFYVRMVTSNACELEYDHQGRIMIPAHLLRYAEIKKEVVIIGVLERIELWEPRHYEKYSNKSEMTFEDVAENLFEPSDPPPEKEN
jgi:MraZ protein